MFRCGRTAALSAVACRSSRRGLGVVGWLGGLSRHQAGRLVRRLSAGNLVDPVGQPLELYFLMLVEDGIFQGTVWLGGGGEQAAGGRIVAVDILQDRVQVAPA